MSDQPSQVASIDFSKKPEGATHYGIMSRGETMWYSLVGINWLCWSVKGEWIEVLNNKPGLDVLPIPEQPDWSKAPADATHWGPATGPGKGPALGWVEAFHKFDGQKSSIATAIATDLTGWAWVERPEPIPAARFAMLIERPQAFDWSGAPEDATHRHIEDENSPFRKLVGASDAYAWVRGEWIFIAPSDEDRPLYEPRPFVPRDFSGPVLDCNPDPEPMSPVEYKSVDGSWKSGVFVGRVYGRIVVGCDETEVVGWLDSEEMRTPRTPEQIAADERLHKIRNAATDIASTLEACSKTVAYKDIAATVLEAMIDAGYARPVKA